MFYFFHQRKFRTAINDCNRAVLLTALGTVQFKTRLLAGLSEEKIAGSKSDYIHVQRLPNFEEIHQACADLFKMTKADLCRGGRGLKNDFRKIAMYACRV